MNTKLTTNTLSHSILPPERRLHQFPALWNETWLDSVFDQLDRAFDVPNAVYPYNVLAIKDKDDNINQYEIEVALAGVGKDAIQVKVLDGQLQISVYPAAVETSTEYSTVHLKKGISQRIGYLKFNLDKKVNCKEIKSTYIDGLLKVIIPMTKPESINIDVRVE